MQPQLGGGSTTTGNRVCSWTRAVALGCSLLRPYTPNQLVEEEDLTARPVGYDMHFNVEDIPSGMQVVLSGTYPRTDFWLQYPMTGAWMNATDSFNELLKCIDSSPCDDCMFGKGYFPQDYTPDEWANSTWCGIAFYSQYDTYTWGYIDTDPSLWYSFVVFNYNKLYSVSSKFHFTPGNKYLNWTEYMFGQHYYEE